MKLGIVIDSSAGITKEEATKRGWFYLPLPITINGKDFLDGVDLLPEDYYKNIKIDDEVKTSATPVGIVEEVLTEASKKFDHVLVLPLSTHLSSQTHNIMMVAKDFKNIHVFESKSVGYAIVKEMEKALEMAKNGASFDEITLTINDIQSSAWGIAAPETLKWLVKGGRIGSGVAGMANLFKIVPMIEFNGKLEKFDTGRVFRKTVIRIAEEVQKKCPKDKYDYIIYHGNNIDIAEHAKAIEETGIKPEVKFFPPVIINHIGPGVVAVIAHKKLPK